MIRKSLKNSILFLFRAQIPARQDVDWRPWASEAEIHSIPVSSSIYYYFKSIIIYLLMNYIYIYVYYIMIHGINQERDVSIQIHLEKFEKY